MYVKKVIGLITCMLVIVLAVSQAWAVGAVSGELRKWHKITITFDGPNTSEMATPNPFTDYRLNVTFSNGSTSYEVPGYFAADGNAANTGATSGSKWRVHFAPNKTGTWSYSVSFREGTNVAVNSEDNAGIPVDPLDGETGSFLVQSSNKTGRDHRGKGRLQYVGEHYLKFAETGEYFLKQGADAPENFLAYVDFDNTPNNKNLRKDWSPHKGDWNSGDPTWKSGKGKGIIGAVNYLASEGMNAFSFIPMNINGDDQNVFPYISDSAFDRKRMDCSKLDQWEIVFAHGDKMGMFLHFKTQETENEKLLDNGNLGTERKLYYRELIARFGHHLALNWNLGEEINDSSTAQKKSWAQYFHDTDPYHHHIVIHNGSSHYDLLGLGSKLTGFSLQTSLSNFEGVHFRVKDYVNRSADAGKPWAVACDEPGDAGHALRPDNDAGNSHEDGRKNALWGTFMAGGWGNEWYFGTQHAHSDSTCQDFRSRNKWWDYCRYALEFFNDHNIPFWQMKNNNSLSSASNDYCLFKKGLVYVMYLKNGGSTNLDLSNAGGQFDVRWYDPRNGGGLKTGSVSTIQGGRSESLGNAPNNTDKDWVVLVTLGMSSNIPPVADAGQDQVVTDADGDGVESVSLDGTQSSDADGSIDYWEWKEGNTILATQSNPVLELAIGVHTLSLTVTDNEGAEDTHKVTIQVKSGTVQDSAVSRFILVNADSDEDIAVLMDGGTLNLATLPARYFSVRAETDPLQVSSIAFSLNGATEKTQTEMSRPYALWGDNSGDYHPGAFNEGEHTLLAEPTLNGVTGTYLQVSFTVINESNPVNNPPTIEAGLIAEPNPVTLPETAMLSVDAVDPEGDTLTYTWSVVSGPEPVGFQPNGTEFSDQCEATFIEGGDYVIRVTVSDGAFNVEKNLAMTVLLPQNNPPAAKGDSFMVEEGQILEVAAPGVLSNDTDPDGDPLTAALVDDAFNGVLVLYPDGSFIYTPDTGFIGDDKFTYVASDGEDDSPVATVTITVTEGTPYEPVSITGYTLINADTDEVITELEDGDTIDLGMLPSANVNIWANTDPTVVGRVVLSLSGATSNTRTETAFPYALWGNSKYDYHAGSLNAGEHTLTATPYLDEMAGASLTINFTVVEGSAITGFTLVNANTNKDIMDLNNGDTISLNALPTRSINIRANTDSTALDSVKLVLSGSTSKTRTEGKAPYALWGDTNSNYNSGALKTGAHTLKAIPYVNGKEDTPRKIEFNVVDK